MALLPPTCNSCKGRHFAYQGCAEAAQGKIELKNRVLMIKEINGCSTEEARRILHKRRIK